MSEETPDAVKLARRVMAGEITWQEADVATHTLARAVLELDAAYIGDEARKQCARALEDRNQLAEKLDAARAEVEKWLGAWRVASDAADLAQQDAERLREALDAWLAWDQTAESDTGPQILERARALSRARRGGGPAMSDTRALAERARDYRSDLISAPMLHQPWPSPLTASEMEALARAYLDLQSYTDDLDVASVALKQARDGLRAAAQRIVDDIDATEAKATAPLVSSCAECREQLRAALGGEACSHKFEAIKDNDIVQANGYEVCTVCGNIRAPQEAQ